MWVKLVLVKVLALRLPHSMFRVLKYFETSFNIFTKEKYDVTHQRQITFFLWNSFVALKYFDVILFMYVGISSPTMKYIQCLFRCPSLLLIHVYSYICSYIYIVFTKRNQTKTLWHNTWCVAAIRLQLIQAHVKQNAIPHITRIVWNQLLE